VLEMSQLMTLYIFDRESLEKLTEIAHKLAGSAGYIDDGDFGRAAAELDQRVRLSSGNMDKDKLDQLVGALLNAA
jgi:hypothetical protein